MFILSNSLTTFEDAHHIQINSNNCHLNKLRQESKLDIFQSLIHPRIIAHGILVTTVENFKIKILLPKALYSEKDEQLAVNNLLLTKSLEYGLTD